MIKSYILIFQYLKGVFGAQYLTAFSTVL